MLSCCSLSSLSSLVPLLVLSCLAAKRTHHALFGPPLSPPPPLPGACGPATPALGRTLRPARCLARAEGRQPWSRGRDGRAARQAAAGNAASAPWPWPWPAGAASGVISGCRCGRHCRCQPGGVCVWPSVCVGRRRVQPRGARLVHSGPIVVGRRAAARPGRHDGDAGRSSGGCCLPWLAGGGLDGTARHDNTTQRRRRPGTCPRTRLPNYTAPHAQMAKTASGPCGWPGQASATRLARRR